MTHKAEWWAARNRNKRLYLYSSKPFKDFDKFKPTTPGGMMLLWYENFPEVTFENSPKKVTVTFEIGE